MGAKAAKIFVNLPIEDLKKSIAFFQEIGFQFDPNFTDDKAGCMTIGDNIYAMLLTKPFFQTFIKKEIADSNQTTEVITALQVDSREEVDQLADKALKAGAVAYSEPTDHGFMYVRNFQDLDGHLWELFFMDEAAAQSE